MTRPLVADTSVPALIVKIGSYPLHHGGVGAIRSLGRMRVPVFAVVEDRLTPAAVSRFLRAGFVWSATGSEQTDVLVDGLLSIGRRIGRPTVLIPTDDEAAVLLAEQASALAPHFLYPRSREPGLTRRVVDKYSLRELCLEHDVPCADAVAPRSAAEVEQVARTARFPLVAKNREPFRRLNSPAVHGTTLIKGPDELRLLARRWPEDPNVVLQEYLPREEAVDWIVHGYFGADADPRVLFTGVKVRSWPPHAGMTSCAFVSHNPELAALASGFCKQIGYSGIVDLDWRYDRRDGRYKLLDFNPRVGAQFRLFETEQGLDVVRAQHLDLTGRSVPAGVPPEGRRFIVENVDLAARLSYLRGSYKPPPRPGREAGTEVAWFARDDVKPYVAMMARTVHRGAHHILARRRDRLTLRKESP
jgi:D-aspartate ligase